MIDNQNKIKISIIMPTYNVEKYVADALESVYAQEYDAFEVICIDNVSIDDTKRIVQKYADKDERIVWVQNDKNRGIAYSRNKGLELATGEYILFLDSDDKLVEGALQRINQILTEDRVDILLFDALTDYETEEIRVKYERYRTGRDGKVFEAEDGKMMFQALYHTGYYADVLWRQCFRTELLRREGIQFIPVRYHEDVVFSFKALMTAKSVKCVPEAFYIYFRRANSLTTKEDEIDGFRSVLTNYCSMMKFWQKNEFGEAVDVEVGRYLSDYHGGLHGRFYRMNNPYGLEFDNALEKHVYSGFVLKYKSTDEYQRLVNAYDKIIIYGAGNVAERVIKQYYSDRIIGIAVTSMDGNPEEKWGFRVRELTEYKQFSKEALIIVAVASPTQPELINNLQKVGFRFYFCAC